MRTDAADTTTTPPTPLAVVGIGCLFPKAAGTGYYWANVKRGVDCLSDVPKTHWNPADYFDADPKAPDMTYAKRGGFLEAVDFNPLEFGIAPRDLEATDTSQLLGLVAAKQALTDANVVLTDSGNDGQAKKGVERSRVSVILGVTGTLELVVPLGARLGHPKWKRAMQAAGIPAPAIDDAIQRIGEDYVPWQENSFPGLLGNVVAGRIANKLDLHGTNCVVDAACASSLSAIHLASMELALGRADVVVTGGVDTFNDIFMFMCFSKTPALSPTGSSKPFDANGDGTILGEGLGMVVLKRLADAEKDGDTIYAVLKGMGTSSDGKGNAIYAPSAEGQKRCLLNAYSQAGVEPETIELVEAHGTGTKVGDAAEASALTAVYGSAQRPWAALGSVKSQIGHTKAAAGAAGFIKATLALYHKVLPPTLKVSQPVEPLRAAGSPFYVNLVARPWLPSPHHPRRAALSAFGFGGSNFHCVLEEHTAKKTAPDWDGTVEILAFSAATTAELATAIANVPTEWVAFARMAEASRATFDTNAKYRLTLVAYQDDKNLPALLAATRAKLSAEPNAKSWFLPEGVAFGSGPAVGTLGILFPGQGSSYPGMLRELACLFPEFLDTLDAGNRTLASPEHSRKLSDTIYPPTSFAPGAAGQHDAALRATDIAQPALGAVSFGAWLALANRFGLQAQAFAGHSYGELPALAAAGRLGLADLFLLSKLRGELMAKAPAGGDAGAMLAALAPLADIEKALKTVNSAVVIANKNAPSQVILSGTTPEIDHAELSLQQAKIRTIRLPVAGAFHHPLVAPAAVPFRAALATVEIQPGTAVVYANTTGKEYPADANAVRDLLGNQLVKPVEFVAQTWAMFAAGVRTFLEVGPGNTLSRLVSQIATDPAHPTKDVETIPLDNVGSARPGQAQLALVLARLAARGHTLNLKGWEAGSRCRPPALPTKPAHTVPICGANYVAPRPTRPASPPLALTLSSSVSPDLGSSDMPDPTLAHALAVTQQTLTALRQMQEQTALLHKQFLDSQDNAQRTLAALVAQQTALFTPGNVAPMPPAPAPVFTPLPATPTAITPTPRAVTPATIPVPAPTPVPTLTPAPQQVLPPVATLSGIDQLLLNVVAEKTGYPAEMLDLGMTLDGDLGIDSIKRVEILATLQEQLPNAPVVKPEHLGSFRTLQDVASYLGSPATPPPSSRSLENSTATSNIAQITAVAATTLNTTPLADILLGVVAEKTGYPAEMLDLGMTLDADLGIDSIKRVEILASLQEKLPGAPQVKPDQLGSLRTLQDVADFLSDGRTSDAAPMTQKIPVNIAVDIARLVETNGTTSAPISDMIPATEQIGNIQRAMATDSVLHPVGMPKPTLKTSESNPQLMMPTDSIDRSILQVIDLDLTSHRPKVPLVPGKEVLIVAEDDGLTRELVRQIAQLGFVPQVSPWSAVTTAVPSDSLAGLILLAPTRAADIHIGRLAFLWLQRVGPKLRQTARTSGAAAVLSVARLDGSFGLGDLVETTDPSGGALAGLVKTLRYEWPELTCKAADIAPSFANSDVTAAAAAIVDEFMSVGPVEVGMSATHRCMLELARTVRRAPSPGAGITLTAKDVILVTGGARGVTAEAAVALAQGSKATLILTGRTPSPTGPEPDWLVGITDEAEMKKAISEKLGTGATPKAVAEQYSKYSGQREIRETVGRIEKTGAKAAYYAVDVLQGRLIADLIQQVRVKFGPVTVLIHGAGVLADKRIENLTAEQFDLVYKTKVDAARTFLDLLRGENLKAVVFFSSTTARFGRIGQLAYAAANEVLNKLAQVESRKRPLARVVAVNWGPWDGGMVTPALRKVFETEGVGLIPLAEGAAFLVQELNASGKTVEVTALGKFRPTNPPLGSGITAGTAIIRNPLSIPVPVPTPTQFYQPPTAPPSTELTSIYERNFEVATHPIVRSHVLEGRAVLPMAIHLEWLTHAALHGNPGLVFHGFDSLRIAHGVMVEDGVAAPLRALAGKAVKGEKYYTVPVELRGKRRDGRDVIHSRAEIVLTGTIPKAPTVDLPPVVQPYPHPIDEVYKYFLFHGPDLHAIEKVEGLAETGFVGFAYPAPPPGEWFTTPLRNNWVADPMVLDASFQMMILWSFAQHGAGSLPCFAGRYRQYRRAFPVGSVKVVIRITRDNGTFARADIDYLDADGVLIAQMQDYECVMDPGLNQAFRRNQLVMAGKP